MEAFSLPVPDDWVEAVAQRAAEILRVERAEESEGFLNVKQAAAFLGRSEKSVYWLCDQGEFGQKARGRWVFTRKELREWVERESRR
jgi:predicted DNA-binding transcriptional regulator AlpA